jgi:hypothetical protein
MSCSITIQSPDGIHTWKKTLDDEELQNVGKLCQSRWVIHILPAALITVRSDNCTNFCKDFFLPTFVNQILNIKSITGKIFAAIFAILFDLATLPIRLLTCIPSILCNKKKEMHPLHQYLRQQEDIEPKLLQCEYLKVTQNKTTKVDEILFETNRACFVNLINIPIHDDWDK